MSIQTQIERLTDAKAALKTAIEQKGVAVPEGAPLEQYAQLVEQIRTGGAAAIELLETLSLTPTEESITIDFSSFAKQEYWVTINVPKTENASAITLGLGNGPGTKIYEPTNNYDGLVYAYLVDLDHKLYGFQTSDTGWANGQKTLPLVPHPRTTKDFMRLKVTFYPYVSGDETATIKVYGR